MKVDHIDAPIYWASYLINGDASGIEQEEIELADCYFKGFDVVDVDADSERFTWSYDLYGDSRYRGGTVATYTVFVLE